MTTAEADRTQVTLVTLGSTQPDFTEQYGDVAEFGPGHITLSPSEELSMKIPDWTQG